MTSIPGMVPGTNVLQRRVYRTTYVQFAPRFIGDGDSGGTARIRRKTPTFAIYYC